MSESWLELVEPCEHGSVSPHREGQGSEELGGEVVITWDVDCPGGRRRRVTPPEGEWLPDPLLVWVDEGSIWQKWNDGHVSIDGDGYPVDAALEVDDDT